MDPLIFNHEDTTEEKHLFRWLASHTWI